MQKRRTKNSNHNKRNKEIEKDIRRAQLYIAIVVVLFAVVCLQIG